MKKILLSSMMLIVFVAAIMIGCSDAQATGLGKVVSVSKIVIYNESGKKVKNLSLDYYDEEELTATAYDSNNKKIKNAKFKWSTSNKKIATVDKYGTVVARTKAGDAKITVTSGGKSAYVEVKVCGTS